MKAPRGLSTMLGTLAFATAPKAAEATEVWEFPKIGGTLFGVLIMRILLFRVLYSVPLISETHM